jgi:hypothetical protein
LAVACVLLGLVTTVAVAWGCGAWLSPRGGTLQALPQASENPTVDWHYAVTGRPGAARVHVVAVQVEGREYEGPFPSVPTRVPEGVPVWAKGWPAASTGSVVGHSDLPRTQDARGWPWLSMWSQYIVYSDDPIETVQASGGVIRYRADPYRGVVLSVRSGPGPPETRILPLGVIWPGFLASALFYALLWLGVITAPRLARSARGALRRRRGLCPRCAYPVGASIVCTECGLADPLELSSRGAVPGTASSRSCSNRDWTSS